MHRAPSKVVIPNLSESKKNMQIYANYVKIYANLKNKIFPYFIFFTYLIFL